MKRIGTACAVLLLALTAAQFAPRAGSGQCEDGHADGCSAACVCACCPAPALAEHDQGGLPGSPTRAYIRFVYVLFRGRPLLADIFRPPASG